MIKLLDKILLEKCLSSAFNWGWEYLNSGL